MVLWAALYLGWSAPHIGRVSIALHRPAADRQRLAGLKQSCVHGHLDRCSPGLPEIWPPYCSHFPVCMSFIRSTRRVNFLNTAQGLSPALTSAQTGHSSKQSLTWPYCMQDGAAVFQASFQALKESSTVHRACPFRELTFNGRQVGA